MRRSNLSPRIASILPSGGYVYMNFQVIPGYRYALEYKDTLSQPTWSVLFPNIEADEPEITYADVYSGGQRFYRLSLIP